jgi:hypothetical protein
VLDRARKHIVRTFAQDRAMRHNAHLAYLRALPFYAIYQENQGSSSLPSTQLQILQDQVRAANDRLKMNVDADWRAVCLKYPQTLDHYFKLVMVDFPKKLDEKANRPKEIRQKGYESGTLESGSNPFAPNFGMPAVQADPEWYSLSHNNLPAPVAPKQSQFSTQKYISPGPYSGASPRQPMPHMRLQYSRPLGSSYHSSLFSAGSGSTYSGSERMPHFRNPGAIGTSPYAMPPPPPPPPREVEVEKKDDTMAKEVEALRGMIKQQEDARIAREEAIIAAEVAKNLKAEQDARQAQELTDEIAAIKAEAEKAAEDTAKKAQEEIQALRDLIKQQEPAKLAQEKTIEQPELAKKPKKRVLFGRKGWFSGGA